MSGIDAAALVLLTHERDNDPEGAWDAFRQLVTDFVAQTERGREMWVETAEDLNVGDLLNDADAVRQIEERLPAYGLHSIGLSSLNGAIEREYDEILVNLNDLPE